MNSGTVGRRGPPGARIRSHLHFVSGGEMQIRNGKDFWAGLMFVGFGAAFVIIARDYPMGEALRMGPAYFPTMLGGLLVLLGMATFVRSFFSRIQHGWKLFEFRPAHFIAAVL